MTGNRGCLANTCLFLVIVGFPILGQAILTIMVFEDEHTVSGRLLWLVIIWAIPFLGPLLYLLFGQRVPRYGRVTFGQPSQAYAYWME
jgi:Phospholipase_D-nuclease N-terminal